MTTSTYFVNSCNYGCVLVNYLQKVILFALYRYNTYIVFITISLYIMLIKYRCLYLFEVFDFVVKAWFKYTCLTCILFIATTTSLRYR